MESEINTLAIAVGAFGGLILGAVIYHPRVLGTVWARGSGVDLDIKPSPLAFVAQIVALVALAIVVGITATVNFLGTALLAILAAAAFVVAQGLFQTKSTGALLTDGFYVLAAGVVMIIAQGIF